MLSTAFHAVRTQLAIRQTVQGGIFNSGVKGMASPRRMGSPEAKNRAALLDAAEQIMLEEGYPAAGTDGPPRAAGCRGRRSNGRAERVHHRRVESRTVR